METDYASARPIEGSAPIGAQTRIDASAVEVPARPHAAAALARDGSPRIDSHSGDHHA
jgi:hypothetical protein